MASSFDPLIRILETRLVRQEAAIAETKAQLDAARAAVAIASKKS
ncbi:MAG: hypothetical protein [Microvirus sp.]|nr:MAG: hypothetical protein [Microvirus sp.]